MITCGRDMWKSAKIKTAPAKRSFWRSSGRPRRRGDLLAQLFAKRVGRNAFHLRPPKFLLMHLPGFEPEFQASEACAAPALRLLCSRADSNCHYSLRRAAFYPLNYEGVISSRLSKLT